MFKWCLYNEIVNSLSDSASREASVLENFVGTTTTYSIYGCAAVRIPGNHQSGEVLHPAVFAEDVLCWCCKDSVSPGYFPCQAEEVSSAMCIKSISDLLMKHRTVCFSQLYNPLCCINLFLLLFYV